MVDPFKIIQDLNLTVGGRIGDDGYAYVDVNRVFGMIKGFFDTPLGLAIEKGEKDKLPLGDRYLNAMYYVQNARTPDEQRAAQNYLDAVGDMIDKQGGIVFPVNLTLQAAPAYTPEGWSPFQHNGAVFNPADGNARTRMTAGQAAGEFIAALDKYDNARGVQPDPQLRSRIGAVINIEEPVAVGPKPASYTAPSNSAGTEPAAAEPEKPIEYSFKPDISLNTNAEFDIATNKDTMPLADKVDAILNSPILLHGNARSVEGGGVLAHDRLVALYDVMTDYVTNGTEPATQEARAAIAAKTFSDAMSDPRTANNYAHFAQQAYDRGNAAELKTAADTFGATLGDAEKPVIDAAFKGATAIAATPVLEFEMTGLKLNEEFDKLPLDGKLGDLLSAGIVSKDGKELNDKERAEVILETLKAHVENAGVGADGKPLEGDALVKAQEAALKEVGAALAGLDAKEQQNLKLLLQEDGISVDGLNPELQKLLQQAALDDAGKAQTGSGKEFGFMELIMAFIAMVLPENSELRQKIETMIDGDKPAATQQAQQTPAAVAAPITKDTELSTVVNDGSYLAFLQEKGDGVIAAYKTEDNIKIVGIESLLEGTKDGKLDEKELAQIDTPDKLAALLKANGFEAPQQALAVAEATEAAVQASAAGAQQNQAAGRGA